jgi:hypothetical protein
MPVRKTLAALAVILLASGFAIADTKVVKMTHVDEFSIMGQTQPADDKEQVTWIGTEKMHMNQGDTATIVRLDLKKLFVINHSTQTYHVLDLPVDLSSLVPPEMQQMLTMMQFDVTVTPVDERKKIGDWDAQRFDMTMASQMFTMKSTMWVTKVAGFDPAAFKEMYVHLNSLQPGMAKASEEMGKINGIVVEQKGVMTMMGNEVGTSEKAISIEDLEAPAGTYDPPTGYTEKPFDFMAQMQR